MCKDVKGILQEKPRSPSCSITTNQTIRASGQLFPPD
jgi:hypothetical protein